jgi:hypothetical protein
MLNPRKILIEVWDVILRVNSLYAEAIREVNSQAVLSASFSEMVWILCEINSEAKPWNSSQSVNLSTALKHS